MKLKRKIVRFIMKAELQSKHLERQIKVVIGVILFNTVNYYLNKVIDKILINVKRSHKKKLVNLSITESFMAKEILCLFVALYINIYRILCQ